MEDLLSSLTHPYLPRPASKLLIWSFLQSILHVPKIEWRRKSLLHLMCYKRLIINIICLWFFFQVNMIISHVHSELHAYIVIRSIVIAISFICPIYGTNNQWAYNGKYMIRTKNTLYGTMSHIWDKYYISLINRARTLKTHF